MIRILIVIAAQICQPAAFTYRESAPQALFHYPVAVSDTSPLGNYSNPAYAALWRAAFCGIAYSKPYSIHELNAADARAGYARDGIAAQAAYHTFGIRHYTETICEGSIAYRPFQYLCAAMGVGHYRARIQTDELSHNETATGMTLSLLLMPCEWLHAGYIQNNPAGYTRSPSDEFLYPGWSAGIALRPLKGLFFTWNLTREYLGYINSFAVSAHLLPALSFRAGYSRETSSYAVACTTFIQHVAISYGIQYHGFLGATHSFSATVASRDLAFENLAYIKAPSRSTAAQRETPPLDIALCTQEDLMTIPVVTEETAGRIIAYREMIGPITFKALVQIGLTEKEAEIMRDYVYNLAPEPGERNPGHAGIRRTTKRAGKYPPVTIEKRRDLFQKLLRAGIPAATALHIADMARTRSKSEILKELDGMQGISPIQKKTIAETCAGIL